MYLNFRLKRHLSVTNATLGIGYIVYVPNSDMIYDYDMRMRLIRALTQKKEQYTDMGFNMGYYIYIYQEQI